MVQSSIEIKESADKVWQALTDKKQMKEWYFDIPDFELKLGSTFNFYEPGDKKEYHHQCVIKEIVPNKLFSYTWTHPSHSKGESLVTWLLDEKDGITTVALSHSGIENFVDAGPSFSPESYQAGWDGFMSVLKNYVYGMRKRKYEINIEASAQKVWDTIWNKDTYTKWTAPFSEGSHYEGEIKQGARIHFLSPELNGTYSDVAWLSEPRFALIQHIGQITKGKEMSIDEEVEKWTGAFEHYVLTEKEGNTLLTAEIDLHPENNAYFDEVFPKAFGIIKQLAEDKF